MSENIAVPMGKELNRFLEEYKPTGYDAPITDEIILTQSDPMKVLPPADDQIIFNQYGTAFMNEKTANKLLALQHKSPVAEDMAMMEIGFRKAINAVLKILEEYMSDIPSGALTAKEYNTMISRIARDVFALKEDEGCE